MVRKKSNNFWYRLRKVLTKFYTKHKEKIDFGGRLFGYFLVWGVVTNFTLWQIFGFKFSILSLFAWGIAFYLIVDMAPSTIRKCFLPRHMI